MNAALPAERMDQYLRFIGRALVLAQAACQDGDVERAEAILDLIHNLPRFLVGEEYPQFERDYHSSFVVPLLKRYPALGQLTGELPPQK